MRSETSGLAKRFQAPDAFKAQTGATERYRLLPFNFARLDDRVLISNDAGDYLLISRDQLHALVDGHLDPQSPIYRELRAKHFIYDADSDAALDLLALKIRTRHAPIRHFTSLHIFVVTLRCDYSCPYCQVSRQTQDKAAYDMDELTARRALEFVFRTPSPFVKIEFQGGEPLLNFPLIEQIVLEAERINKTERRNLQFVIATNLSFMDDRMLDFCERHDVYISTSLDGPADIHNVNRPRPGKNGHQKTRAAIERVRARLGPDKIAALMTTSEHSLSQPRQIIDEYIEAGFKSIFLRPISPYGFAVRTGQAEKYGFGRFFAFYEQAMDYIIELNHRGAPFIEEYSALVLRKLLSPYPTSYVDLQSPTGAVISAIVFNYDGGVYASDESRMLAEMQDRTFLLGNLRYDSYESVMLNPTFLSALEESLTYGAPECFQCAFQPYCGSDPIYHHATQKDWVGHKAYSAFCERTKRVTGYLIRKLENDPSTREVLLGWVQR